MPRILLVTTDRLPSTARIAIAFARAGSAVVVLSPDQHPVQRTSTISGWLPYTGFRPMAALEAAICQVKPDLIIPCDDRAVQHLHRLHAATEQQEIRAAIVQSLSPTETHSLIASRYDLLMLARHEGVRVPDMQPVRDTAELREWGAKHPFPWVLKADGSWAGQGVRIVSSLREAERASRDLTRPVSARQAFSCLLIDRNAFWLEPFLSRSRRAVSVQCYVEGWPANCAVACWDGEMLAGIAVEVVEAESRTGPSTVARVTGRPEMLDFARRIIRALRLSGLVGFDFMIEAATNLPYMIEMNPRNTPICHLQLGQGRDLIGALQARLTGHAVRDEPPVTRKDIIALFPEAWMANPASKLLHTCFHDVPWDEPELMRELLRPSLRERSRLVRHLRTGRPVRHNRTGRNWIANRLPPCD